MKYIFEWCFHSTFNGKKIVRLHTKYLIKYKEITFLDSIIKNLTLNDHFHLSSKLCTTLKEHLILLICIYYYLNNNLFK